MRLFAVSCDVRQVNVVYSFAELDIELPKYPNIHFGHLAIWTF
jgi:hypothetical protein